jgi:acylphosphatase
MPVRLRITGLVQGVGYRAAFAAKARELDLSGWVRNRVDGSVEALVDGDAQALDTIAEWARRGPAGSRVQEVQVNESAGPLDSPAHIGQPFRILSDA